MERCLCSVFVSRNQCSKSCNRQVLGLIACVRVWHRASVWSGRRAAGVASEAPSLSIFISLLLFLSHALSSFFFFGVFSLFFSFPSLSLSMLLCLYSLSLFFFFFRSFQVIEVIFIIAVGFGVIVIIIGYYQQHKSEELITLIITTLSYWISYPLSYYITLFLS